ncbi:MAG: hypothetical protein GKR93_02495 [Gammaproteobacteria bacterium]|nr:hypothetical protein [Gammaproteobacteria bacterium]
MSFVHFVTVQSSDPAAQLASEKIEQIKNIVRATPDLSRALFFLPTKARDYYTDDGASPSLALQLYYKNIESLERPICDMGNLQAIGDSKLWNGIPDLRISHQAMTARDYTLTSARAASNSTETLCSYLVHYPGQAEDFNTWLNFYLDHHPQILRTFEGLREIEVYTRVDWRDTLGWDRVEYMQRNRLIFDSVSALEAALNSPVRHKSRADFEQFPTFTGSNIHYPMLTEELLADT